MTLTSRICLVFVLVATAASYYKAYDRGLWYMEAAPVLIVLPIVILTRKRFPLTPLLHILLAMHAGVLLVGAHSSYARTKIGYLLQNIFNLKRNPWDRIGHFAQGFIPAILTREILLRRSPLKAGWRQSFLTTCVCLAASAMYELIEWAAAKIMGKGADDFLGTQGDQWDTQWDMFLCLVGAIVAQVIFYKIHNRQLVIVSPAVKEKLT